MARLARQESSSGLYHVVMRGNNQQWIFKEGNDLEISYNSVQAVNQRMKY